MSNDREGSLPNSKNNIDDIIVTKVHQSSRLPTLWPSDGPTKLGGKIKPSSPLPGLS